MKWDIPALIPNLLDLVIYEEKRPRQEQHSDEARRLPLELPLPPHNYRPARPEQPKSPVVIKMYE